MRNGSSSNNIVLPDADWRERLHEALALMRDEPAAGRAIGRRMRTVARAAGDRLAALGGELVCAFALFYSENLDAAHDSLERLLPRFRQAGDTRCVALCLYGMLSILRRRGLTHEAYALGRDRMLPALTPQPTRETPVVLNAMGVVAQECGLTEEAIRHFHSALEAARMLDCPSRVAQILANIGEVFYMSGNAEDAEQMLAEAHLLARQSPERWLLPFVSTVMALSKLSLGKYEEGYQAIAGHVEDVEHDDMPNVSNRAFCLSVAAYTLAMRDQLDDAERLCGIAMSLLDRFEERQLKPYTWWVSGHLHHRRGRLPQAIEALHRALEENGDIGYVFVPLRALRELTDIHARQGNWETAYREQLRYQAVSERAQSQATRVRLQTLHIRNELREAETRQRLAEQVVAERETILENSLIGIILLRADGYLHWANRAMRQMFRMERDWTGMSLEPFYSSREEYLRVGAEVKAAVKAGQPFETELRLRRADGTPFWAVISGRSINPNDLSRGTVWCVMDITKRRQLEADLSKSEEHHRQVINNVTECILVVQDRHIVFANPRVSELTGYTLDEVFALPFTAAVHPDDRALVTDNHMRRVRGEPVEQYYQFRVIHKQSKETIWVELSAVMIEWEGKPATLSFMTDITARRRLEERLKRSMEERMRLQTLQIQADLKEAELARHHAEEATRAKSLFLANMSHEIRTPMNAIVGMAHLVLRTELNDRQRDYIGKIHNAAISLLGIINDILDFSKIEAGKLDIEHIEFDLDDVLANVAAITSGRAHEKGLLYLFRTPPAVPRKLIGDPLRLGQVLINLVNNAVKFTDHGEIHVECRQRATANGCVELEFSVRDTGIGMSSEQIGRLFRAFSQADESTTRRYGGTGLGLSIAKAMVELMDGAISLDSAPGAGTTIRFSAWFGLAASPAMPDRLPAAVHGMRVLVVDDHPLARAILAESLSVLPVDIDQAGDARQARAAIRAADRKRPYGVVFADLRLPQHDIIGLLGDTKRDPALRAAPCIVLVGACGHDEIRYGERSLPADGFLAKPVSTPALLDTMAELFGPSRALPVAAQEDAAIPRFSGLTVLLVEDNEINQRIAAELMEAAGITVDIAHTGGVALGMLQAAGPGHYGMVLMDVQMPDMDGHEAARRLRADARFAALPIVAMTAHAMVEERARCFASGMDDHLAKPIAPARLYQTIARWCPRHRCSLPPECDGGGESLHIDGIDVREGLRCTLGDHGFYLQMLARFRDGQCGAASRIRALLHVGDGKARAEAERLAHTLKGTAGQLGAGAVQALAGELESRIRNGAGAGAVQQQLDRLESAMTRMMQALSSVLPQPEPAEPPPFNAVDHDQAT
jgi:two-component system sensor histidine kinase/response regulator